MASVEMTLLRSRAGNDGTLAAASELLMLSESHNHLQGRGGAPTTRVEGVIAAPLTHAVVALIYGVQGDCGAALRLDRPAVRPA